MVRISFVVGGGKLVRQKYSDDLPKHFCSALTLVGFQEERQEALEFAVNALCSVHGESSKARVQSARVSLSLRNYLWQDNSATVEQGSAGKFKYHHDTNKNLKFVHVFPKISEALFACAGAVKPSEARASSVGSSSESGRTGRSRRGRGSHARRDAASQRLGQVQESLLTRSCMSLYALVVLAVLPMAKGDDADFLRLIQAQVVRASPSAGSGRV